MISSTLRVFSSLLILTSMGLTLYTFYFMVNDLSSMQVSLTVRDLEVSGDSLYFDLILNFTYSGLYPVYGFKVEMDLNGNHLSSNPLNLKRGLSVIRIPASLDVELIGGNLTATMTITGSYAHIMPFSVTVPPKDHFKVDIFTRPVELTVEYHNETHAIISSKVISIATINVDVLASLRCGEKEVGRVKISPPINAGRIIVLEWYVKYEDLAGICEINLYISMHERQVKIYSWRFKVE